jgi:hypothetical protein
MRAVGIGLRLATPAHFAALWGSALYTLPKYEAAPPATEWGREEIAIDVFHHLVYIGTAAIAFELLDRSSKTA